MLNVMDDPLVGMRDCPGSPLWFKKVQFLEGRGVGRVGGACCD